MAKTIVFGGSSGLGSCITNDLLELNHSVVTVSRTDSAPSSRESGYTHKRIDLSDVNDGHFSDLCKGLGTVDSVCFAQRYRPTSLASCIEEYKVTVLSVAAFIEYLDDHSEFLPENSYCRIVVIGSSYSYTAGRDQNWSYHSCKHSLQGLVRYFSANVKSRLLIYMVNPATFMKKDSEEYWAVTRKADLWRKAPSQGLISITHVSKLCVDLMLHGNPLLAGSNLAADWGLSNLYPDQI